MWTEILCMSEERRIQTQVEDTYYKEREYTRIRKGFSRALFLI